MKRGQLFVRQGSYDSEVSLTLMREFQCKSNIEAQNLKALLDAILDDNRRLRVIYIYVRKSKIQFLLKETWLLSDLEKDNREITLSLKNSLEW